MLPLWALLNMQKDTYFKQWIIVTDLIKGISKKCIHWKSNVIYLESINQPYAVLKAYSWNVMFPWPLFIESHSLGIKFTWNLIKLDSHRHFRANFSNICNASFGFSTICDFCKALFKKNLEINILNRNRVHSESLKLEVKKLWSIPPTIYAFMHTSN